MPGPLERGASHRNTLAGWLQHSGSKTTRAWRLKDALRKVDPQLPTLTSLSERFHGNFDYAKKKPIASFVRETSKLT